MNENRKKKNDPQYFPHMNGGPPPLLLQPPEEKNDRNKNIINMTTKLIENSNFIPGFEPITTDDNSNLIPNDYLRPFFDDLEKFAEIQAEKEKIGTKTKSNKTMLVRIFNSCIIVGKSF